MRYFITTITIAKSYALLTSFVCDNLSHPIIFYVLLYYRSIVLQLANRLRDSYAGGA